jgi:hypothetical protein
VFVGNIKKSIELCATQSTVVGECQGNLCNSNNTKKWTINDVFYSLNIENNVHTIVTKIMDEINEFT